MLETCVVASGSAFLLTDTPLFRSTAQVVVDHASRLAPPLGQSATLDRLQTVAGGSGLHTAEDQHAAVCAFLECLKEVSGRTTSNSETRLFVEKCREYDLYLEEIAARYRANARQSWRDGVKSSDNPVMAQVVDEIARHLRSFGTADKQYLAMLGYKQARLNEVMPPIIADLWHEANLAIILPMFEKSLAVPGDLAEFGCFQGNLSVKLAWLLKAAGAHKHYYAFDTFHGFEIDDPAGLGEAGSGRLGVGAFQDNNDAYNSLTKWSQMLPLTPVKGDATKTCAVLTKPLSFVWLDLDMDVLMDPILHHIWPLCSTDTVIGIDDVGRPENPTVGPWVEQLIATGAVESIFDSENIAPGLCIRFVRKKGELPANIVGAWRAAQKQ
jgi:hypothetical protein